MPLARIITDSVDDSLELTMQLRSRGFQVETVAPGEIPTTPADLEVRLEECNAEDVLTRTAQVSEADDLWVFVAPGALDESARPVRTIPLMPPVVRIPDVKATLQPRPKAPATPPAMPFITPEDDPILLELLEFKKQAVARTTVGTRPTNGTNGNGTHAAHQEKAVPSPSPAVILSTEAPVEEVNATPVPALKIADHQAEVFLFPTAPDSHSHAQPMQAALQVLLPATSEPAPESSADLRFWRIACVAAGLAIAALLVGVNLSQTDKTPIVAPQVAATKPSAGPPSSRNAGVVPAKSKPVVSATAKPPAGGRRAAKPSRSPTVSVARSPRNARTAQPMRHVPRAHPDDIIATDTVVFFDRKGSPSRPKTKSVPAVKHRSDLD